MFSCGTAWSPGSGARPTPGRPSLDGLRHRGRPGRHRGQGHRQRRQVVGRPHGRFHRRPAGRRPRPGRVGLFLYGSPGTMPVPNSSTSPGPSPGTSWPPPTSPAPGISTSRSSAGGRRATGATPMPPFSPSVTSRCAAPTPPTPASTRPGRFGSRSRIVTPRRKRRGGSAHQCSCLPRTSISGEARWWPTPRERCSGSGR